MKIGHPPNPPSLQREPPAGKPSKAGRDDAAPASTTVTLSDAAQNTDAPAGLLKVQARLQDLGEARTRGQGVALERISRNIARYLENQARAPASAPAPAPAPVETPPTDAVAEAPVADTPAPVSADPPAESAAAESPAELPTDNTQALLDALDTPPQASA
ncbi:MAG: hypothetical protein Q8R72_07090 [Hylemonella sp.]|nr:hypothetical protein [Hylemonella sp.]